MSDQGQSFFETPTKTVIFKGTVASASAVPQKALSLFADADFGASNRSGGISKSAVPNTNDTAKYEYFATATSKSGLTAIGEFGDTPSTARIFSISLAVGEKWKITCGLREATTKVSVMEDSCGFDPSEIEPIFTHTFILTPCKGGSGSVALEITVPSDVIGATVECSEPKWTEAAPSVDVDGTKLTISADE
ncbi:MAG: hypothetical protein J5700_04355, partial [Treponema sp.]|nr:hypothetical protein [Treponema sp.]